MELGRGLLNCSCEDLTGRESSLEAFRSIHEWSLRSDTSILAAWLTNFPKQAAPAGGLDYIYEANVLLMT